MNIFLKYVVNIASKISFKSKNYEYFSNIIEIYKIYGYI